jgi:hypothetical protein
MLQNLLFAIAFCVAIANSPPSNALAGVKIYDVKTDFGANCDGSVDDAAAFQAAITAAANAVLEIPDSATCRIRSRLNIANPITIRGRGGTVLFDFPTSASNSDGGLFNIQSSGIIFDGLKIDGAGIAATIPGVNRYAIVSNPGGSTRYADLIIRNSGFTNLNQYSGTLPATSTVMHAIYLRQVDRARIENNRFYSVSGTGVSAAHTTELRVARNQFIKTGWPSVLLHHSNASWTIADNTLSGSTSENPVYWGGGIEVMGQTSDQSPPGRPDVKGLIAGNLFNGGVYRYGAALRIASADYVDVRDNVFDQPDVDQVPALHQNVVVITVRDVTLNNGPHKNVSIKGNRFVAKGTGTQKAVHVITTSGTSKNTIACENLLIDGNQFIAPTMNDYYGTIAYIVASSAGYKNITISNNDAKVRPARNAAVGIATSAAIVLHANPGAVIEGVSVVGNNFEYFNGIGSTNQDVFVNANARVFGLRVEQNVIKDFARMLLLSGQKPEQMRYPRRTH